MVSPRFINEISAKDPFVYRVFASLNKSLPAETAQCICQ